MRKNRKQSEDVAQLAARLAGDATMEEAVREEQRATELVSTLEHLRVCRGLRQKDIAERMGISVSAVSRIEDSRDADLRYGDLTGYVDALGMRMALFLEDPALPAAEQIKHCVIRIAKLLKQLADLARECNDDPAIVDGIVRFRGEVLFNFFARYLESEVTSPVFTNASQPQKGNPSAKKQTAQAVTTA